MPYSPAVYSPSTASCAAVTSCSCYGTQGSYCSCGAYGYYYTPPWGGYGGWWGGYGWGGYGGGGNRKLTELGDLEEVGEEGFDSAGLLSDFETSSTSLWSAAGPGEEGMLMSGEDALGFASAAVLGSGDESSQAWRLGGYRYTCYSCPVGTYCPGFGVAYSVPPTAYQSVAGSSVWVTCAPGKYSSGSGSGSCVNCPAGSYQVSSGQAGCTAIPAGNMDIYLYYSFFLPFSVICIFRTYLILFLKKDIIFL